MMRASDLGPAIIKVETVIERQEWHHNIQAILCVIVSDALERPVSLNEVSGGILRIKMGTKCSKNGLIEIQIPPVAHRLEHESEYGRRLGQSSYLCSSRL